MYIGTIHGFCLDLLKTEVHIFLKYDVVNEVQQRLLIDRNSVQSGLTTSATLNGRQLRRYVDTGVYIQALAILRESKLKQAVLRSNSVNAGLRVYRSLLHNKGYLDYSSIMEEAVGSLRADRSLRSKIQKRIKAVIVDEYQDVNPIQEELVSTLQELGARITVVGDDDQTIYQWRGGDVDNILTFTIRYPKVTTVKLEENFRSSKAIVDVARTVIEKNENRLQKAMRSVESQTYDDGDIVALQFGSPDEEAEYIAAACQALSGCLINDGGRQRAISWSDMAVLVRVNVSSEPIRQALLAKGVPVVSIGMSTLFETPEAEAARQLFYMMGGRADKKEVLDAWLAADLGVTRKTLSDAISAALATREQMMKESAEVRFSVYNIQRQFIGFLERIGLREQVVPNNRGEVVFYNLAKFSQAISDFEQIHFHSEPAQKYQSFAGFLQHQAESAYAQAGLDDKLISPDAVQILTVHQAKGLQWPVVFVPQLVKNRFPSKRQGGMSAWHLLPANAVRDQARFLGSEEDERRLFYVAVTRSQKHLHLTTAPTPGNQLYQRASEFWYDVLESKFVRRRKQEYTNRVHGVPQPRSAVENVGLTFSDIKYFLECPYQFKLRILYGFNPPIDEALGYGKSLHDMLAELHGRAIEGERITSAIASELVQRHLRVPFAYPTLRATMRGAAEKVVREYIRARQSEFDKLEFSEKDIEVAIGDGITVKGRIDLVRRRDTDEIAIVDLKSSDRAQTENLTDAQLHIYALGYRDLTGRNADYVETYELDSQTRHSRSVDDAFVEDVKGIVKNTARALRANRYPHKPSREVCGRCDFSSICSASVAASPRNRPAPTQVSRGRNQAPSRRT